MSDHKSEHGGSCCDDKAACGDKACKKGCNKFVVLLVVLIVAGAGLMAIMSGKMKEMAGNKSSEAVESTDGSQDETAKKEADNNTVLAKVNGKDITRGDVIQLVEMMPPQMRQLPLEQLLPMALEQVINNEVISNVSDKAGLDNDADVLKQLELAKKQIIRAQYLENELKKKITEDDLKAEYEKYLKDLPEVEEVHAQHILVDSEAKAKDIIAKLEKGESFETLAKENSSDGSAESGGDLGYFAKNEVVPQFADAAFALKAGEYSKNPVKTDFGFHVIKILEKRMRPPTSFEEAKSYLEQELRRSELEILINELRKDSKIERFDAQGNPIVDSEVVPAENSAEGKEMPEENAEKVQTNSEETSSNSADSSETDEEE